MNDQQRIARAHGAIINALATDANWLSTSRQLVSLIGSIETQAYVRRMLRMLEARGAVAHIGSGEASRWTLAAHKQRAIALHLGPPKALMDKAARHQGCSIAEVMELLCLSEAVTRRKMWLYVERGALVSRTYPNRMVRFFSSAEAAATHQLPIMSDRTLQRRRRAQAFTVVTAQDKQQPVTRGPWAPDAQAITTERTRHIVAPAPAPRWDVSGAAAVVSAAECRPWVAAYRAAA